MCLILVGRFRAKGVAVGGAWQRGREAVHKCDEATGSACVVPLFNDEQDTCRHEEAKGGEGREREGKEEGAN
jgi:hypothetical protein